MEKWVKEWWKSTICHLRRAIPLWLEDLENALSPRFRRLLSGLWDDLRALDGRIAELDTEIALIAGLIRWQSACTSCAVWDRWSPPLNWRRSEMPHSSATDGRWPPRWD